MRVSPLAALRAVSFAAVSFAAVSFAAVSFAAVSLPCARALAQDLDPASDAWNGLSEVVRIAEEDGIPLEVAARVDVGELGPEDALLIVHPTAELPAASLTELMRAGGRVALCDDFGEGGSLLATFRIGRARPSRGADVLQLRGNPELLVARPVSGHPLTQGVSALVTNHPQIVVHDQLEPIFELAPGEAVVLAGAVGGGRLVAVADSSVLINNMLELGGNRRFVANLLRYLRGEGPGAESGGRIILVPPDGVIAGRFGEPGADRPLHDVRALFERLAEANLPPTALRIAAAALAGILLAMAAGLLPRRSPYGSETMFARAAAAGGFVGRVQWFADRRTDLGEPMVVYKLELETELARRLGLSAATTELEGSSGVMRSIGLEEVSAAMKRRGLTAEDVKAARVLLRELAEVEREVLGGARGEPVGERRMRRLFREGELLLAKLEAKRA